MIDDEEAIEVEDSDEEFSVTEVQSTKMKKKK